MYCHTSQAVLVIERWLPAVRFPQMVKRMASIAGASRPSPWTLLWLRTVIEEPITSHPAFNEGFYTDATALQAGSRRQGHCMALTLPPAEFFRPDVLGALGFASVDDYVRGFFEGFMLSVDPNNLIVQARKARAADPAAAATWPRHSDGLRQRRS
jgi:homoserine O-acetyltransferase/O-succinyltransferase